jgi:iron complex transport system ATP-binding protein
MTALAPPDALVWTGVAAAVGGTPILDAVDLAVPRGTWLSILGPNGAGKTTLLRTLAGGLAYDGHIAIAGRDNRSLSPRERAKLLAVVPQLPVIPPATTVFDYVLLGRAPHQGLRLGASLADRRLTIGTLQRLDLDRFVDRRVDSLSGGERQRVVLARALVQDTEILVLDEPTAFLDIGHQLEILELIADLRTDRALTVVTTLHDLSIAGQFADLAAVLANGRIVAAGRPAEVLTPDLIGRWWGVHATTEVAEDGSVAVHVQRRREHRVATSEAAAP